jgi:hypothetical protein
VTNRKAKRVIITFPQDLLEQVDEARGLVSRAAWIRMWLTWAVTNYPLSVVEDSVRFDVKGSPVAEGLRAAVQTEATHRRSGLESESPSSFVEVPDQPVPVTNRGGATPSAQEPPDLQRRDRHVTSTRLEVSNRSRLSDEEWEAFQKGAGFTTPEPAQRTIQHCNRGACTGVIKPNGRCIRCNQIPK